MRQRGSRGEKQTSCKEGGVSVSERHPGIWIRHARTGSKGPQNSNRKLAPDSEYCQASELRKTRLRCTALWKLIYWEKRERTRKGRGGEEGAGKGKRKWEFRQKEEHGRGRESFKYIYLYTVYINRGKEKNTAKITEPNIEKGREGVGLGGRGKKKGAGLVRLIAPELCRKNKLSCRRRAELGWAEQGTGTAEGGHAELIKTGRSLSSRPGGLAHNIKGH